MSKASRLKGCRGCLVATSKLPVTEEGRINTAHQAGLPFRRWRVQETRDCRFMIPFPTAGFSNAKTIHNSERVFSIANASGDAPQGTIATDIGFLEALVKRGGPKPDEYAKIDAWIATLYNGHKNKEQHAESLNFVRHMLKPVLIPETMHGWAYLKPHGYAGDFEIIDRHYLNYIVNDPALAAWDHYWQQGAAAKAVRNRKSYFHTLLEDHVCAANGKNIHVLNIASGPGRDVQEFLEKYSRHICFECLDQDSKAIEHASKLCNGHAGRTRFIKANVLKFKPDRQYDVIWSAGLFDYFSDRTFKLLLRRLIPAIAPGGQLVIGNFSKMNPNQHWLHFCEWHLHHRSSEQLIALAIEAGARHENVFIGKEPEGVNLFLHINDPHAVAKNG